MGKKISNIKILLFYFFVYNLDAYINSNKNDYNEINETISFYSTKNPIFQTETKFNKRYYYNSSLKIQK